MIDPTVITNFNRTERELQEFLLFCICVAGKTAWQIAKKVDSLIKVSCLSTGDSDIFLSLSKQDDLYSFLISRKIGNYKKHTRCFRELIKANLDLRTSSVEDLEKIHGIGPKTARYFVLHSRDNSRVACLDRHVLKWLGEKGHKVPKSTPSGNKYKQLESIFIKEADMQNISISKLDLNIWNLYARAKPESWT